jgi:hypothetical protein
VRPRQRSRETKAGITFWVEPRVRRQLRVLALQTDQTLQSLLDTAIESLFREHGRPRIFPKPIIEAAPGIKGIATAALGVNLALTPILAVAQPIRPDDRLTPGAIDADATTAEVCARGYARSHRNVPPEERAAVFAAMSLHEGQTLFLGDWIAAYRRVFGEETIP